MQGRRSTYQSLWLQSLALWLLRLYPRRWRGRYEGEVQALLEEHAIRLRTLGDLLTGAFDARLDPAYAQERSVLNMRSPRLTTVSLFCAFALFGIALLPLLAFLLDPEDEQNVPTHYGDLVSAYPLVGLASSAILVVSLLAGVALLATFFVLALGRIPNLRGSSALALLVLAVVAALVVLVPELLPGSDFVRQLMPALLGIVVSIVGIGAALTQSRLGMTQWRALLVTAATTTLAMVLIAIGAVTWLMTVLLHASLLHFTFTYSLSLATGAVSSLALATVIAVLVVSRAFATRWGQHPLRAASQLPPATTG
jgi:hypothetical protein